MPDAQTLFQALALQIQGKWVSAQLLYEEVLRVQPEHFDALRLLAVIAAQTGHPGRAADLIGRAIAADPNHALAYFYRASVLHENRQLEAAIAGYSRALDLDPGFPEAHMRRGGIHTELEQWDAALADYTDAVAIDSGNAEAHYNRAVLLDRCGQLDSALSSYARAIEIKPNLPDAHYNLGILLYRLKRWDEALASFNQAVSGRPDFAEAYINCSAVLLELKQFDAALASCDRAIALKPDCVEAHSNRGSVLRAVGQWNAALKSYDRAIELDPAFSEAYMQRGGIQYELERWDAALADFTQAAELDPGNPEAHCHRALLFDRCGQLESAATSYARAIDINPNLSDAHYNLGTLLCRLKRWTEALASCCQAISSRPDFAEAHINLAAVLLEMKQFDRALASYDRAIALKPDHPGLLGCRQQVRMMICDWTDLEAEFLRLTAGIERDEAPSSPYHMLCFSGSAALQKRSAEHWMLALHPVNRALPAIPKRGARDRIRIGYFSSAYCNHATMTLMGELFELHDRSNFEVTAFALASGPHDATRTRLEAACEVIDVSRQSDKAIVLLARNLEIDIAVDLMGFTQGGRPGIFALRAAPVQVNYLGYPGTMGAQCMDYLIADRTLIPPGSKRYYSERVIYLPDSYQANDAKREIGVRAFTRPELGLPEAGVVFCCFNSSFKILPGTFDSWMRILTRVEGSVLWLYDDNPQAVRNLRREAELRHVPAERLVFAPHMPPAEHRARLRLADLLLDTQPYNAHTTASDALWAGLPVLTLVGQAFAGRVAASLLRAIDLPELIADTAAQYEQLAVELGTHPKRLVILKQRLARNRLRSPLFDAPRYTRYLEAAYAQIHTCCAAGLPPIDVVIERDVSNASRPHWH